MTTTTIYVVSPCDGYSFSLPCAAYGTKEAAEAYVAQQRALKAEYDALPDDDEIVEAWLAARPGYIGEGMVITPTDAVLS